MDLLSSTKNFIFMLMESPSIYWFLLAFYYFRATDEEVLPPYSSFFLQSMFLKDADCEQLLSPSSLLKTTSDTTMKYFF